MSEDIKPGEGGSGKRKGPKKGFDGDVDKLLNKYNKKQITPFMAGFDVEQARNNKKGVKAKSLLKRMLDVPITVQDLPTKMADKLRKEYPGFFDDIDRKFTMKQVVEMIQFNLLFARSDFVKQNAIEAIKNRIEGKPMQRMQVEEVDSDPTEFILSNGRKLTI